MDADGAGPVNLTPETRLVECPNQPGYAHRGASSEPSWSPDGARLAFRGPVTCPHSSGTDIWVRGSGGAGKGDGPGLKIGGINLQMGEGEQTLGYRHVEHVLPVDGPVYVLGTRRADGRIGAAEGEGGEGRFLISHRSEEDLGKGYRKDALVLGLVAAGLLLFGAVFLAVGLGAGLFAAGPAPDSLALGAAFTGA